MREPYPVWSGFGIGKVVRPDETVGAARNCQHSVDDIIDGNEIQRSVFHAHNSKRQIDGFAARQAPAHPFEHGP